MRSRIPVRVCDPLVGGVDHLLEVGVGQDRGPGCSCPCRLMTALTLDTDSTFPRIGCRGACTTENPDPKIPADHNAIPPGWRRFDAPRVRHSVTHSIAVHGDGLELGTRAGRTCLDLRAAAPLPAPCTEAAMRADSMGELLFVTVGAGPRDRPCGRASCARRLSRRALE